MEKTGFSVHEITSSFFNELSRLNGWQITSIGAGEAVAAHSHEFDAMYFTNGVKELYSEGSKAELPELAAVFIPKGTEHAWSGVRTAACAQIGHFHPAHGMHKIVAEY